MNIFYKNSHVEKNFCSSYCVDYWHYLPPLKSISPPSLQKLFSLNDSECTQFRFECSYQIRPRFCSLRKSLQLRQSIIEMLRLVTCQQLHHPCFMPSGVVGIMVLAKVLLPAVSSGKMVSPDRCPDQYNGHGFRANIFAISVV